MIEEDLGGFHWELQPEFHSLLRRVWDADGEVVKESPHKLVTVHRVDHRVFYIKRYRHGTSRLRPLKYLFRKSPAWQEWRLATRLAARGIPIVAHLALGEHRRGPWLRESVLVTEEFPGDPLYAVAEAVDPAAVLRLVEQLHAGAVTHPDLHPGNILVSPDRHELRLVDLDGIRFVKRLHRRQQQRDLAFVRMFVPIPVSDEVRDLSERLRRRTYARRAKRAWKHNRGFQPVTLGALRWQVRTTDLTEELRTLLANPDLAMQSLSERFKSGRSSTVARWHGRVIKHLHPHRLRTRFADVFRRSRAWRAFRKAYHLELVGIPTARPVACGQRRRGRWLGPSYLVTDEIPGLEPLHLAGPPTRQTIRQVATLVARLHDEGFSHRDLKTTNLLIDPSGQPYLLDMEGLRYVKRISRRRAVKDLARLGTGARAWVPDLSLADQVRFMKLYCAARQRPDWRQWAAEVVQRIQ